MDYRGKERGQAAAMTICFQGCELGAGEISRIRAIVAKRAEATRRELAALVCRELQTRLASTSLLRFCYPYCAKNPAARDRRRIKPLRAASHRPSVGELGAVR